MWFSHTFFLIKILNVRYNKFNEKVINMLEITQKDNYSFDDCCKYRYEFKTDDLIVDFYQSGNRDLYFTCYPREENNEYILEIKAIDNYVLYNAVDELYKDITDISRWEHGTVYLKEYQEKLFNGEYISWESDDCIFDDFSGEKKYNYLNIFKIEDGYIFKFINNSNRGIFSISFNTDRSKYRMFAFSFYKFLSDLKEVVEDNKQICFDEYLLIKKYKGE